MSGAAGPEGEVRDSYRRLWRWVQDTPPALLQARSKQAEPFFRRRGIPFAVYGDDQSNERIIPFDITPRILDRVEWARVERGLIQRVGAINAFLTDVYGPQDCLRAGIIPPELVLTNPAYRLEM